MQIAKLAEKFQVEKLEERTEFYVKTTIHFECCNGFVLDINLGKANPKGPDPVMPDLTVLSGFTKTGVESYEFNGPNVLKEMVKVSIIGV